MHVLVSTSIGQGLAPGDYHFGIEGELVYVPALDCARPDCGCERGFAGLASARATTTARVVDRPDLDEHRYSLALADGLSRQGWLGPETDEETPLVLGEYRAILAELTAAFAPGTVVERSGDQVRARLWADAP